MMNMVVDLVCSKTVVVELCRSSPHSISLFQAYNTTLGNRDYYEGGRNWRASPSIVSVNLYMTCGVYIRSTD